jgi:hypothetical protein
MAAVIHRTAIRYYYEQHGLNPHPQTYKIKIRFNLILPSIKEASYIAKVRDYWLFRKVPATWNSFSFTKLNCKS